MSCLAQGPGHRAADKVNKASASGADLSLEGDKTVNKQVQEIGAREKTKGSGGEGGFAI